MNTPFFVNEPFTDFSVSSNRKLLRDALERLESTRSTAGLVAYPIINGQRRTTPNIFEREDPSTKDIQLGTIHFASRDDVDEAFSSIEEGRLGWQDTPISERASILNRAASIMQDRRHDLNALIIREVGKPWKEADADVAEAIDFCRYYAERAFHFASPIATSDIPGEENVLVYHPRGTAVVIAPWNFPFAIACGMTVAALVTGNGTILKPAEQSSLVGFALAELLLAAGVPPNAFAFLPGQGEDIGRALVEDKRVDLICFTGSRAVGQQIISSAATPYPEQRAIKRVIAELGGKNAIIVDEDADEDDAIRGILASAFGFAGQKCSACSRLIVVGKQYSRFIERLIEAAADLIVGPSAQPETVVGPVVDDDAYQRLNRTIEHARQECRVVVAARNGSEGYFIPPTIIVDPPLTSSWWSEELFGPVICTTSVATFDDALRLATDSPYALTGGVFSRNPRNLEAAKRHFAVGNLYLNRAITGALVARQPFGGSRMSGIGSKAGGPDYLLQFVEPRTITENTSRRGFVPEIASS
jgi:RHH-type proline utilization regulon transcriptional repressor/proline dehydrogenase/delta 1-pyrroline-5-carboxylate dehydrogenase